MMKSNGEWSIDEARDPIHDTLFRMASLNEVDAEMIRVPGALVFSAKIYPKAILPFLYFSFPKKMFSKRAEKVSFTVRIDSTPPFELHFNPSDTGTDAFVDDPGKLYLPMVAGDSLLLDLPTMSHGTRRMRFKIFGFDTILLEFIEGMIDFPVSQLLQYHPSIVDHLLRRGEKGMSCIVDALNAFRPRSKLPPFNGLKTREIFSAVQEYAIAQRASEIFGLFEGRNTRPNESWVSRLYNSASTELKKRWGPLVITD